MSLLFSATEITENFASIQMLVIYYILVVVVVVSRKEQLK